MGKLSGLLRTHHCGELRVEHLDQIVTLCGWVNKTRDLGSLNFVDLRDKYGVTQLGFENFKGDLQILKECSLESVISVSGVVKKRPQTAINKDMDTGEVEIQVENLSILSKAEIPPFLPSAQIEAGETLKLKYRYLDLRTHKLQNILKERSEAARRVRNALYEEDFIEVETPILYKSTPEGARDYIVPSRVHKGKVYALPQSPQTLKQLLMIGNTDKYFQLCKCFRDEDLRADRQPEFTQIDIEVSFAKQEYIKKLATKVTKALHRLDDSFEIPSMSYEEAMKRYGSDKPDTRFGLEHYIVNDIFQGIDFGVFKNVLEGNGLIKAIFIPESLKIFSRKEVDRLVDVVKPFGGKGVAWFKVTSDGVSGGISKFIKDDTLASLKKIESDNGTWFFFADTKESVAHDCADAVRRLFGKELGLYTSKDKSFLWVYDFPLLVFDDEDNRFYASHHPFTAPHPDDLEKLMSGSQEELKNCRADAYDLVCNGYEIAGGSVRIHNNKVQNRMFEVLGMSQEEAQYQFGFFLQALKYGTPPHAGIAFGFDRNIMILCETDSITDIISFPKTTSASDLMADAPSIPAKEQCHELHFDWLK